MSPYTQDILLAWAAVGILVLGFTAGLIGLRWLWRRTSGASGRDVLALQDRVEQLEAERGRLAEIEERLDFAERLLAQQAEIDKLAGGR
jgi:hypothetical protein